MGYVWQKPWATALAIFALACLGVAARGQEISKLVIRSWNLCDYKTDLDGQWEGSIVASDGCCYFASSTHSGRTGAMFFKFDPIIERITVLAEDITRICGEDPTKDAPQGKNHSDIDLSENALPVSGNGRGLPGLPGLLDVELPDLLDGILE